MTTRTPTLHDMLQQSGSNGSNGSAPTRTPSSSSSSSSLSPSPPVSSPSSPGLHAATSPSIKSSLSQSILFNNDSPSTTDDEEDETFDGSKTPVVTKSPGFMPPNGTSPAASTSSSSGGTTSTNASGTTTNSTTMTTTTRPQAINLGKAPGFALPGDSGTARSPGTSTTPFPLAQRRAAAAAAASTATASSSSSYSPNGITSNNIDHQVSPGYYSSTTLDSPDFRSSNNREQYELGTSFRDTNGLAASTSAAAAGGGLPGRTISMSSDFWGQANAHSESLGVGGEQKLTGLQSRNTLTYPPLHSADYGTFVGLQYGLQVSSWELKQAGPCLGRFATLLFQWRTCKNGHCKGYCSQR